MFRYLLAKARNIIVTLRFSLLSVFVLLFLTMMLTMLSIFYFHLSEVVLHAALLLMDKTSATILSDLDDELRPVEIASQFSANSVSENVLNESNMNDMIDYLLHLVERMPVVQAAFWGDAAGRFAYVQKTPNGYIADYHIDTQLSRPAATQLIFDKKYRELSREKVTYSYDPRTRPWYQLAVKHRQTIWTNAYPYDQKSIGITVGTPVFFPNGQAMGVFGIDVRLDSLGQYVAEQKVGRTGEVFIMDTLGRVIVSPFGQNVKVGPDQSLQFITHNALFEPWLSAAFDIYQKTANQVFQFESKGQKLLASFKPIPILKDNNWMIVIIAPESDFTRAIHKIEFIYLINFLLIFLTGLALMSQLVTKVVRPIKMLVKETERIKHFELEGRNPVHSQIKEVIELSNAIHSMKKGLRSFQKYVPAGLVRQLIKTGEDAVMGGAKRELAIFFSDIQDFTATTDKLADSNLLVKQICEYFEVLSHAIIENKGTIDKYIGDSVMAFWGAPVSVKNPAQLAANAALHGMRLIDELNHFWSTENLAVFPTHIGIHFGEAIVGSLGSSERLNYTALGDTANIASRLVSANKLYGTRIMISGQVYERIKKDFICRLIDCVVLKGKTQSIDIYELLGDEQQRFTFDVNAYRSCFEQAFTAYRSQDWQKALALFKECLILYPEDKVAAIFIDRCIWLDLNHPPADWDGVWHISEK